MVCEELIEKKLDPKLYLVHIGVAWIGVLQKKGVVELRPGILGNMYHNLLNNFFLKRDWRLVMGRRLNFERCGEEVCVYICVFCYSFSLAILFYFHS